MPRHNQHLKNAILLECPQSFSSGPQASSTPTHDPSNITWTSDLSPIETSKLKKEKNNQKNTSPDPFGFKEIRGIHPEFKTVRSKSSKKPEISDKESSDFSLSSEEKSPLQNSKNEEKDLTSLPKGRLTRTKSKNLKYKESESDNDLPKKKRKYTRKHQNVSEDTNKEDNGIYEKDTDESHLKKQAMLSKNIIEYFREVDKFKLEVEDVPEDYTSES